MPNGFIAELAKWQEKAKTSWEAMERLEGELVAAGEAVPVWKKALYALPKIGVVGFAPWFPAPLVTRAEKREKEKIAKVTGDYDIALVDYQRAAWFTLVYSATKDDLTKSGIVSMEQFLQLHPPESGTPSSDIATATHYINSLLGKAPPETADEVAAAFITEPLETRPRFKGVHLTTVEEMVKYLRREVTPPELPPGLGEEDLLEYLKEQGYTEEEMAEAERMASPWIAKVQEFEASREQIKRYKLGLDTPGLPEETFGTKLKRAAVQPMLALMDVLEPYWTYWDYPRSGQIASWALGARQPFMPWVKPPLEAKAELDALYQKNRDVGMNHWMAWSKAWEDYGLIGGWGKIAIEVVSDPLTYFGFGLAIKAAKATKGIPVLGRFLGLIGAAETGFIKGTEAPMRGAKFLIGKLPKTIGQRTLVEGRQTFNSLVTYFEQRGGSIKRIPQEDFTKYALEAIDYRLANPGELNWIASAGDAYVKRVPMSREIIMELGSRLGIRIGPEDISHAMVGNLEDIMTNVNIIGSMSKFTPPDAAAQKIATEIFNISDTPENVKLIRSFMEEIYDDAVSAGIKMAQLPKKESLASAVEKAENLMRIIGEEGLYEWKMRHGITAALLDWIDPLARQVWSNGIEKHLIMPFARSYLITGLYAPWNWAEEIGRAFFGRGGALHGRNAPIRLANDVGTGLRFDRSIVEGADVAALGYKGMAKAVTRPTGPIGWGEMSEAARLAEIERQAGKPFLDKLLTFAWLPKIGRRVSEIAYTPIRASALFGSMEKSGYTIVRYYDELGSIAPDTVATIRGIVTDPPSITGVTKATMNGLKQMAEDAAFVGPSSVESVAERFTQRNIKTTEVYATKQKYPSLGAIGDDFMELTETGEIWKDIPGHINKGKEKAMDEFIQSPEYVAVRLKELVDEVLTDPVPIKDREHLLGFAKWLGELSQTSTESISRLFVGLHTKVSKLPSAVARKETYATGYRSIEPFLNALDTETKRIAAHIRANVGDLLSETEWRGVERQLNMYLARIENLKATRIKAMNQANRMVAEGKIKPGTLEWYAEQDKIWGEFWRTDPDMFAKSVVHGESIDSMISPQLTPKPIINASARGLTSADVGTLLYAQGDKLSYAMMNSDLLMRKEYFVALVKEQANVMATRAGATREALGFTDDAIGKVYDQLIHGLRSRPEVHNALTRINAEIDNFGRDLEAIRINNSFDADAERAIKDWLYTIADGLREMDIYKVKPVVEPLIRVNPDQLKTPQARTMKGEIEKVLTDADINPRGIKFYVSSKYKYPEAVGHEVHMPSSLMDDMELFRGNIAHEAKHVELTISGKTAVLDTGEIERLAEAARIKVQRPAKPPTVPPAITREGSNAWWDTKQQAMDAAMKSFYHDFTDYTNMNMLDSSMRHIFPYWQYESGRWLWLPRNLVQHPGVMNSLAKYQDNSEYGYIHVPGTNLSINPLVGSVYKGGLSTLTRRDYPEYYDRYFPKFTEGMDYIQRWGFYPNAFWGLLIGTTAGREPQTGELLPAIVSTPLDLFVAAKPDSVPAKMLYEILFPDRFRQYMQIAEMHHLATNDQINRGINGEYIWSKMQRNEDLTEEEKELYNQSVRNVALRNAWVEHANIFKLRHEDRIEAYQWFDKVKEEATGVPVEMQEWARRHGYTLGDIVPGLSQYDIMLVEEMEEYKRWITPRITAPLRPSNEIEDNLILSEFWGLVRQHSEDSTDRLGDIECQVFSAGIKSRKAYRATLRDTNKGNSEYIHKLHGDKFNTSTGQWEDNPNSKSKYRMVPITAEARAKAYIEKGYNLSMSIFDEMLAEWFQLSVREKIDYETGIPYEDWGTYFATQNAIEKLMTPELKSQWDAYLKRNETPGRAMYRNAVDNYLVPYWAVDNVIKKELFTPEEQSLIDEYYLIRDVDPIKAGEMKEILRPDGTKLISQYTSSVANARKKLRMTIPMVDAQLLFWGYTTTTQTPKANELYQQLVDTARNYYTNIC